MRKAIFILCCWSSLAFAKYIPEVIGELTLKQVSQSTIRYSLNNQIKTKDDYYLPGEFPTQIRSTLLPALVGVGTFIGRTDEEASGFTTASVINILGQLYLDFPEYRAESPFADIPKAIQQGVQTFQRYQDGLTYNFYPPLVIEGGKKVRRPIGMTLFPIWHGFTNIPNDSDTSSAVGAALLINEKISKQPSTISPEFLNEFSKYTDEKRSPMWYNNDENRKDTGAFMTWLFDENDKDMARFYFASSEKGARIPFNKNDVDCVVNANILKMLALAQSSIKGQEAACTMLNDMIMNKKKDENASCGVYYPNTYNLAFAMASARHAGDSCLQKGSIDRLVAKLIKEQNANGSWNNIGNAWKDENLSTAFALSTLLELGDVNDRSVGIALYHGVRFLMLNAKMDDNKLVYWEEDNFFTATAIARSLVMWKSKAYTNSIIASILLRVHRINPNLKVQFYTKSN